MRRIVLSCLIFTAMVAWGRPTTTSASTASALSKLVDAMTATLSGDQALNRASQFVDSKQWGAARSYAPMALGQYRRAKREVSSISSPGAFAQGRALLRAGLVQYVAGATVVVRGVMTHNRAMVRAGVQQAQRGGPDIRQGARDVQTVALTLASSAQADTRYQAGASAALSTAAGGIGALNALATSLDKHHWSVARASAQHVLATFKQAKAQVDALQPTPQYQTVNANIEKGLSICISGITTVLQGIANKNLKAVRAGYKQLSEGTAVLQQASSGL